jgi:biotin carboxyl carrier protein
VGSKALMLYYINLGGREFPLTSDERSRAGRSRLGGAAGDLEVEVLSHPEHGRPALILVDGTVHRVWTAARPRAAASRSGGEPRPAIVNGRPLGLRIETELERRARPNRNTAAASSSRVIAPMPGRIVKIDVKPGDVVTAGAPLLGIEAMKMENELFAPSAGRVARLAVQVGSIVEAEQELIVIEPI